MDKTAIEESLSKLEFHRAAAFAAACCQRAFPACVRFFERVAPDKISIISASVEELWRYVGLGESNQPAVLEFADQCTSIIPDLDCYIGEDAQYAAYAQNSMVAMVQALLFCGKQSPDGAIRVSRLVIDLVDSWLQHTLFTGREILELAPRLRGQPVDQVRVAMAELSHAQEAAKTTHPVYLAEIARQEADIKDFGVEFV